MEICKPEKTEIPQLLQLWKEVFGDHAGFWELFLRTGFSRERCRVIREQEMLTAALTWLDCSCRGRKIAYVYAVVTHPDRRGRGLCRKLMADTQTHLASLGYAAVLLVPAEEALGQMYEKLGYRDCTRITEFSCAAGDSPVPLRTVTETEYTTLRREMLPDGSVLQEGENLAFLAAQTRLYAGDGILLAAYAQGQSLHAMELLGEPSAAPGILKALGFESGHFRTPGTGKKFAMWLPLNENAPRPAYFGFAFD